MILLMFINLMHINVRSTCTSYEANNVKYMNTQLSTCLMCCKNTQSCEHNSPTPSTGGRQRAHTLAVVHPMNFAAESTSPFKSNNKYSLDCRQQHRDRCQINTRVKRITINQISQIKHEASLIGILIKSAVTWNHFLSIANKNQTEAQR